MSKYSEVIGSFIRRGNYPLEADYIFPNEATLKEFYQDPVQNAILHKGFLKVVEDDGMGNQALYWVTKKQTNDQLEFTKLISGDFVQKLVPQVEELIQSLQDEIKERKNGDYAIWGTINPTIISEDLNSILDLSIAVKNIQDQLNTTNEDALNGIVEEAYYDSDKEALIISFKLADGSRQVLNIPFTNVIREWEPDNSHPSKVVEIVREEVYSGGADKLSADVRISTKVNNILEKDGNSLLVQGTTDNIDHNGTALSTIIKRLQKRITALEEFIEDCGCGDGGGGGGNVVTPISILGFTADTPLVNDLGSVINPTFTWSYNTPGVDLQTLNGINVDSTLRSKQLTGISTDTTVILYASYKGYTAQAELKFVFSPRVYYGGHSQDNLTNIKELPSTQLGASIDDAKFNCEGGKYAYYAVPSSLKDKVSFVTDDTNPDSKVISYTTYNITVDSIEYTVFKLDNKHNTQFEMDIKVN